ncbi:MAG: 2-dehydro-3-deoxygalactonokinase [Alphaproteobacteria bacterium]|nr:2-dehydro-3-deoxygalactonokinase [Alphaproteobacteria bacterium]
MDDIDAIGVDWGTSSFRAYRLAADGAVLEARSAAAGILAVDDGDFEGALEHLIGDWLDAHVSAPVVLSGMIGSRNGWVEAPYLPCPASLSDLSTDLHPVTLARGRQIHIAPGVSTRDPGGVPDVMRGEEVQVLGALSFQETGRPRTVCLPGTHSKWVTVCDGRIEDFSTHMTGEAFDVLRRHSILGRTIEHAAWNDAGFLSGVGRSGQPGGFLHHIFGVRASGLFGELPPERAGAFLSGLVIGTEIRAAGPSPAEADQAPIVLIGEQGLVSLYQSALHHLGLATELADRHATALGLWLLSAPLRTART